MQVQPRSQPSQPTHSAPRMVGDSKVCREKSSLSLWLLRRRRAAPAMPALSLPRLRAFSLGRSGWRRWWSLVLAFLTDGLRSRPMGLSDFGRATMCGHSLRAARERLSSPSTFSRGEGVSTLALRGSH